MTEHLKGGTLMKKHFILLITIATGVMISCGGSGSSSDTRSKMPKAPTALTAEAVKNTSVILHWSAIPDATSYKIYRSSDGILYRPIAVNSSGTTDKLSYTDTGLAKGTRYFYKVSAMNQNGEGEMSDKLIITR
jgi:fibronectin type 3 domain-containing protein